MALLAALDEGLTRLIVAAEEFGSRRSWRLGRYGENVARTAQQGLSSLSERLGWNRIPRDVVETLEIRRPMPSAERI